MLPQVLFTAHEHKSMIVSTDALLRQDRQIIPVTPDNNKIYEYTLGNTDMYEFIIPTCSYRMGTDKIGYGFAVLERNELRYTVLWSPSRFRQLSNYLTLICFVLLGLCFHCCCCRNSAPKRFIWTIISTCQVILIESRLTLVSKIVNLSIILNVAFLLG
jgi:hypothetical protein